MLVFPELGLPAMATRISLVSVVEVSLLKVSVYPRMFVSTNIQIEKKLGRLATRT